MTALLHGYRRLLSVLAEVERALIVLLILNIILNIGTQVFSRYVLGEPLVWVEELATYSFIWATFLGAALALKHGRHIKIESFIGRLPPPARCILRLAVLLCVLAICVTLMREALVVMGIEGRRTSISLPVDLPISLFFSIPLFIGLASMTATLVYLMAAELHHATGFGDLPPIVASDPAEPTPSHHEEI